MRELSPKAALSRINYRAQRGEILGNKKPGRIFRYPQQWQAKVVLVLVLGGDVGVGVGVGGSDGDDCGSGGSGVPRK